MALFGNRVKEQITATAGTATFQLEGNVPATFRAFGSEFNNNDAQIPYVALHGDGSWEIGEGTYISATDDLQRDTVLQNSLGTTALINFGAGIVEIFSDVTAKGLSSLFTNFDTKADVEAASIADIVKSIQINDYYTAGDGGGATYNRVGSDPSHNLKVLSLDGAWWELVPDSHGYINVKQAGAKGDNVTDDGQAFIDALSFASLIPVTSSSRNATYGVIVPPSPTKYYLGANTLELKRTVHLVGQGSGQAGGTPSALRWDANVTGIIVHAYNTIGAGKEALGGAGNLSADSTKIEGLHLFSDGGTIASVTDDTKGHGIWLRSRAVIVDLKVTSFPGNGINIVATSGSGDDAREGNANNWVIERARIEFCHLNGIFVDGADVNAGHCIGADCSGNGRWGIHDTSFLGNTYIGCHTSGNGLATGGENGAGESSYVHLSGRRYAANAAASEADLVATTPGTDETVWYDMEAGGVHATIPTWLAAQSEGTYFLGGSYHSDNANARNVFTGGYSESGQGPSQWVTPTIVFGGSLSGVKGSAIIHKDGEIRGKIRFPNHDTDDYAPSREMSLVINASPEKLLTLAVEGDHAAGMNIVAWDEVSGHMIIGEHANVSSRRPIRITTNLNATTHGRSSAQVGGELYFYKGFWAGGNSTVARWFAGFNSGFVGGSDAARGDKVWNYNPSSGDVAGWRVTTAGTVGSTAVIEEYFYLPDLPGGHPGYNIRPKSDGANKVEWREAAKAGTDTIADAAATVAVTFATAYASANYSVALSADGDERVWVTAKTASGFTLNRLATSGARAVDWTATPYEDLV